MIDLSSLLKEHLEMARVAHLTRYVLSGLAWPSPPDVVRRHSGTYDSAMKTSVTETADGIVGEYYSDPSIAPYAGWVEYGVESIVPKTARYLTVPMGDDMPALSSFSNTRLAPLRMREGYAVIDKDTDSLVYLLLPQVTIPPRPVAGKAFEEQFNPDGPFDRDLQRLVDREVEGAMNGTP